MSHSTTSQGRREIVGGTKVPDMRQRAWRGCVWKKTMLDFVVDCVHFEYCRTAKKLCTDILKAVTDQSKGG